MPLCHIYIFFFYYIKCSFRIRSINDNISLALDLIQRKIFLNLFFFQLHTFYRCLCSLLTLHLLNCNYLLSVGWSLKSDLISVSLMSLE